MKDIRIPNAWADIIGQVVAAVVSRRVTILGADFDLTGFNGIRWIPVSRTTIRLQFIEPPQVSVDWWPDPDLPFVDLNIDGTGKVVAKGRVATFSVPIVRKT